MKSADTMTVTEPNVVGYFASSVSYIVAGKKYDQGNGIALRTSEGEEVLLKKSSDWT
jgi:hypothetical protein